MFFGFVTFVSDLDRLCVCMTVFLIYRSMSNQKEEKQKNDLHEHLLSGQDI